jgi:signal transduction histidine kinase/DNA-binding response OmpR family regulator
MTGGQISPSERAKLLVVEDEAIVAMDLQRRLTSLGYSVLATASTGEEAIRIAAETCPGLILMDIRLRGQTDGVEAAEAIRARCDVPVVYLTALADEETLNRAKMTAPFGFLVKPFEERELHATIEMALHKHRLETALREGEERLRLYAERLTVLHDIDRAILAAESPEAISRAALRRIRHLVTSCRRASVTMFDFDRDQASLLAVHTDGETRLEAGRRLPLAAYDGIPMLEQGKYRVVDDLFALANRSPADEQLLAEGIRSCISLPLIAQNDLIGTLDLGAAEPGAFGKETVENIQEVASSLAVAARQARLREEAEHYCSELEVRNEDLAAFAHTVAHDLQDPLGIIVGFSSVLCDSHVTMPDEELGRYLDHIAQSGSKMYKIIQALLLLAETRREEVEILTLDMAAIVAEAHEQLAHQIEEYRAEIAIPDTWPVALGYAPWVEEVWVNYISNALKYGARPPHVELGAAIQADGQARFWVSDDGPGISPMDQDRLFIPFTRISQVRARGHGLGLSIVRRIVEKLGGQVGVESEMGHGSTFSFTLPRSPD